MTKKTEKEILNGIGNIIRETGKEWFESLTPTQKKNYIANYKENKKEQPWITDYSKDK